VGGLGKQLAAIEGRRAHADDHLAGLGLRLGNIAEEERRPFGLELNPARFQETPISKNAQPGAARRTRTGILAHVIR